MYLTKDAPSVESLDDLPACTDSREGDLVLLSSLNAVYVCDDGKWEKLDIDDLQEPCSSSSSSTEISSSSVEVSYGTFTDSRDGQVYKTVQTGEQVWMAENLNYAYLQAISEENSSSFCYNNKPDSCVKYGRLYLWSAAMDSAGLYNDAGKGANFWSSTEESSMKAYYWFFAYDSERVGSGYTYKNEGFSIRCIKD